MQDDIFDKIINDIKIKAKGKPVYRSEIMRMLTCLFDENDFNLFCSRLQEEGVRIVDDADTDCSKKFNPGNSFIRTINSFPPLSDEDTYDLLSRTKNGDMSARELLINSNIKLVVFLASPYASVNLPLLDLVHEGCLGLAEAIDSYDAEKNPEFSGYLTERITKSILSTIESYADITGIPALLANEIANLRRTMRYLHEEYGREPTVSEIAEAMEITGERVESLIEIMNKSMK